MLYGLTIFLSAFLLFQVQFISAKKLLPWFGGAPSVWTTCQVFFQVALLAGYAYSHWLSTTRRARRQASIHIGVLAAACAALIVAWLWAGVPILAPAIFKPSGTESPVLLLFATLFSTIGIPFFTLATTSPLIQRWHSQHSTSLSQTYRLYALSNAGSLIGLLSYPFVVERFLDLNGQAWEWSGLFVLFAALCAILAWKNRLNPEAPLAPEAPASPKGNDPGKGRSPWLWLLLSFCSSAMFLATTNRLCQEVAVIPFLWALPLGIYLLSFIVCFDRPAFYWRTAYVSGLLLAILAIVFLPTLGANAIVQQILLTSIFLWMFCMISHGELARLRPAESRLTLYYLLIATGGALGGAFVNWVAPFVFTGVWEFYVTMIFGLLVFGLIWLSDKTSPAWVGHSAYFGISAFVACFVIAPFVVVQTPLRRLTWVTHAPWAASTGVAFILAVLIWALWARSALARANFWPRILLVLVTGVAALILVKRIVRDRATTLFAARNFYGVVRVMALENRFGETVAYKLVHGVTNHGEQFKEAALRKAPIAYFSPASGIGLTLRSLESEPAHLENPIDIGVLGMGIGTLAAYARSGDHMRFYEINPIVIDVAGKGSEYFSYVRDCEGSVSVVPGDARLSLEREREKGPTNTFDLLAVDAFSSDSIPVHLLTLEAFKLYASLLKDRGSILAVQVTNAYLDIEPVVAANARELGFGAVRVDAPGDAAELLEASSWILLSRNPEVIQKIASAAAKSRPLRDGDVLFTDQYSNLFRVLKKKTIGISAVP